MPSINFFKQFFFCSSACYFTAETALASHLQLKDHFDVDKN